MDSRHPHILYLAPGYPCEQMPSESTFYHRRAKQMQSWSAVTVFTLRAITPASYVRYFHKVRDYYSLPRHFRYHWDGVEVSCEKVHFWRTGADVKAITSQRAKTVAICEGRYGRQLGDHQYDVIVFAGGSLSFGLAAADLARKYEVPLASFVTGSDINHTWDKPESRSHADRKRQLLANQLILAVSADLKQKVDVMTQARVPAVTYYAGVDVETICPDAAVKSRMRQRYGIGADESAILFLGHLIASKGIYELMEVCRRLQDQAVRFRCFLVGRAERRDVARLTATIRQYGLTAKVQVVGGVPHREAIDLLKMADLFLFPSWFEGLPNAVMEAAAAALPIVATWVGGIPEIIRGQEDGWLVPPQQVQPLFHAVRAALMDREKARRAGMQARKRICAQFDARCNAYKAKQLFDQLLFRQASHTSPCGRLPLGGG